MKKILLLILIMFLITGCKVEYNLVINNDLTVSESVKMTGTDDFFEAFYKSSKMNVVEMLLDEGRRDDLEKNNYKIEIIEKERPYVIASKKYPNLNNYASNTLFLEQYFNELDVSENNGIVSIKTLDFIPISSDSIERYVIKTTMLSITVPYEVIENNAISFDKMTNTYTWYINDDVDSFSLLLSYDTNEIYEVPKNNDLIMVIVSIIFIIGLIITTFVLNKKNK